LISKEEKRREKISCQMREQNPFWSLNQNTFHCKQLC
jgi:hypothetical protein